MYFARYDDYKNMIAGLAWQWKALDNVEELICEGNVIFMEALKTYDETKASFSTYLTSTINGKFQTKYLKQKRAASSSETVEYQEDHGAADGLERKLMFKEAIDNLPDKARQIVEMVIKEGSISTKRAVTEKLQKEGWSLPTIWKAMTQIKSALKQLD